jgi:hypothetical protein
LHPHSVCWLVPCFCVLIRCSLYLGHDVTYFSFIYFSLSLPHFSPYFFTLIFRASFSPQLAKAFFFYFISDKAKYIIGGVIFYIHSLFSRSSTPRKCYNLNVSVYSFSRRLLSVSSNCLRERTF